MLHAESNALQAFQAFCKNGHFEKGSRVAGKRQAIFVRFPNVIQKSLCEKWAWRPLDLQLC